MAIVGALIKRGVALGERLEAQRELISPIQHQRRTLKRLLKKAAPTAFGQYYKECLHNDLDQR